MTLNLTVPTMTQSRAEWAASIRDMWTPAVDNFIATGRELVDAKASLPHGEFEAMVESDLPFGPRTARRLMAIAADRRIANRTPMSDLPASWGTLYELTRLDDATLAGAFAAGRIRADMLVPDVKRLRLPAPADACGAADAAACAIEELRDLADRSPGFFRAILADPPWTFETYSDKGKDRSPERHYDCMTDQDIAGLPIRELAADDCVLFLWCTGPKLEDALWVIHEWGFDYKTMGFTWAKLDRDGGGWWSGMGFWTRSNPEFCLLATRGKPKRLPTGADVQELIIAPIREHSRKPPEARHRIARLVAGPYLELFARSRADGWDAWGAEAGKFDDDHDEVETPAKPTGKFADPSKPAQAKPKPASKYEQKHGPPAKPARARTPVKRKASATTKAPAKGPIRHTAAMKPSPDLARIKADHK